MTFVSTYDLPFVRQKFLYKNKPYFMLCNNYDGTVDLFESAAVSYVGEYGYIGVLRSVEKSDIHEVL